MPRGGGKLKLPAVPSPESIVAVIDSREKLPLNLSPLQSERGTLTTGDYSLRHLEHVVAIERKSLPDLLACVGVERERFQREIDRLRAFPSAALVIESSWEEIELGCWRSKVSPASVTGSLIGWSMQGLPVHLVGDHQRAGVHVSRMLFLVARRRYREARSLLNGAMEREEVLS